MCRAQQGEFRGSGDAGTSDGGTDAPQGFPDGGGGRNRSIRILDPSGKTGRADAWRHPGDLTMSSVDDMVNNVLGDLADGDKISKLTISTEGIVRNGKFVGVEIGSDVVTKGNFALYRSALQRLSGSFASDGVANMQVCRLGQDEALMKMFSDAFGVRVVGTTGVYNVIVNASFFGHYVQCNSLWCGAAGRP
jgi:hypothetical protein